MSVEVYIGVTLSDGFFVHVAFQTVLRAPKHPGGPWNGPNDLGIFTREATDANIEYELSRAARAWQKDGRTLVSWRRLTEAEHDLCGSHRYYRNALEDVSGQLKHNMTKARVLHREALNHINGGKLLTLDRVLVDAMLGGKKEDIDSAAAARKALRDRVIDPAIDAAQTIEVLSALLPLETTI